MHLLYAYRDLISRGALPRYARAMAAGVAAAGARVSVVAVAPAEGVEPAPRPPGTTLYLVRSGLRGRNDFRQLLRTLNPDLVHLPSGMRLWIQALWGRELRAAGIPYVVSGAGNLTEPTFRHRWGGKTSRFYHTLAKRVFYAGFDRRLLRNAAAVHGASTYEAEVARALGARDSFALPFTDFEDAPLSPPPAASTRLREPLTFTYLGRLAPVHKGLDLVIDAFGAVTRAGYGDRFRLVLAGTDEKGSMEALKRRAEAQRIRHIEFPGGTWGEEKAKLFRHTDFFLHMCRFNGFAMSVREALRAGVPLITTRESDYGDWVSAYNMGIVVPISTSALTETLISTFTLDPATYDAWSAHTHAFIRDTAWQANGRAFLAAYRRVLGQVDAGCADAHLAPPTRLPPSAVANDGR